jgi:hypothetical protein
VPGSFTFSTFPFQLLFAAARSCGTVRAAIRNWIAAHAFVITASVRIESCSGEKMSLMTPAATGPRPRAVEKQEHDRGNPAPLDAGETDERRARTG